MQTIIFIPARYSSVRFPGKPLQMLRGASGQSKSLVQWSWDAAAAILGPKSVFVLTDDDRIATAVTDFGGRVLMTSSDCRNGTERCAEAVGLLDDAPDLVVNLQGDAPLTPVHYVEALIEEMQRDPAVSMATPVLRTEPHHLDSLRADRKAGRVGATTVVFDTHMDALYFSKEIIPYSDDPTNAASAVYHHVGCYAYRPDALTEYKQLAPGKLENKEGLEQLRFLEHGIKVRCVEVDARGRSFWELNNPTDIPLIETIMKNEGIG